MTNNRDSLPHDEWLELCQAAHHNFETGDISEREYRLKLAHLGFNATEIEREVELRSSKENE
jgi:hypothetical protein